MRSRIALLVMFSLLVGVGRRAVACPPVVQLGGDPTRVAEVTAVLAARGVAATPVEGCPALTATVATRGKATVVSTTSTAEPAVERVVTDARTAATVIESWARTDVEAPLLARGGPEDSERPEDAQMPTPAVVAGAPPFASPGTAVTALAETGIGNDRTTWVGFEMGACSGFGPSCAGGRVRASTVVDGPGEWEQTLDREAVDALVGADLPLHVGRLTAASGIGAGLGWTHTHEDSESSNAHTQTIGLRGELRLTVAYPVGRRAAVEAVLAFAIGQKLYTSTTGSERLPNDARLLGHVGLGLRFDGP